MLNDVELESCCSLTCLFLISYTFSYIVAPPGSRAAPQKCSDVSSARYVVTLSHLGAPTGAPYRLVFPPDTRCRPAPVDVTCMIPGRNV